MWVLSMANVSFSFPQNDGSLMPQFNFEILLQSWSVPLVSISYALTIQMTFCLNNNLTYFSENLSGNLGLHIIVKL